MPPATDIDKITYIAEVARETWEIIWPSWKRWLSGDIMPADEIVSQNCCIPTSFALCEMLERCVPTWEWSVVGGNPTVRNPTAGFSRDGVASWHLWVQGRRRGESVTVDITADQFGGEPVTVIVGPSDYHRANITRPVLNRFQANEQITISLWTGALVMALQFCDDDED